MYKNAQASKSTVILYIFRRGYLRDDRNFCKSSTCLIVFRKMDLQKQSFEFSDTKY